LQVHTKKYYTYQMETMKIYNVYDSNCPTRAALDLIADKWAVLILGLLEDGPRRFSALQRGIEGISQKMLTQTLRELERDGLISRTIYPEVPPHVEYALSALGCTLSEPISAVRRWAEEHIVEVTLAQQIYKKAQPGDKKNNLNN
jgi:DNA-binding HxlR family transcriptional regulator